MELNHQIRLCRPFPFLFGFRANRNVIVKCKLRFLYVLLSQIPPQWRTDAEEEAYVPACSFVMQS
jgi:hypothetical protein